MANDYQDALKGCKDKEAVEKVLREYADDSHPLYRPHDRADLEKFRSVRSKADTRTDGLARLLSTIALVADNPIDFYICGARMLGISDVAIASVLDVTMAFVGKRRKAMAKKDEVLGKIINEYMTLHPAVPRSLAMSGQHPIRFNCGRTSGRKTKFAKRFRPKSKARQLQFEL